MHPDYYSLLIDNDLEDSTTARVGFVAGVYTREWIKNSFLGPYLAVRAAKSVKRAWRQSTIDREFNKIMAQYSMNQN